MGSRMAKASVFPRGFQSVHHDALWHWGTGEPQDVPGCPTHVPPSKISQNLVRFRDCHLGSHNISQDPSWLHPVDAGRRGCRGIHDPGKFGDHCCSSCCCSLDLERKRGTEKKRKYGGQTYGELLSSPVPLFLLKLRKQEEKSSRC